MTENLEDLSPRERRGSRARCILLTNGSDKCVSERLTEIIAPWGQVDPEGDHWMPQGFSAPNETKLRPADDFLSQPQFEELADWWLSVKRGANIPNWDIASTAVVEGSSARGLVLVEAKAHDKELTRGGKGPVTTANSARNHECIGGAIKEANVGLESATGLPWGLSRDMDYQMSNRFAWAWKIAEMGTPVILVYLGFLRADEMEDQGEVFGTSEEWEDFVTSHTTVPADAWNPAKPWLIEGTPFVPIIRSQAVDLS